MKFYTGSGDAGSSVILGLKKRIPKTDKRFSALGAVDELNSCIGICRSAAKNRKIHKNLLEAQKNLFLIQAMLGGAKNINFKNEKIKKLESAIDEFGNNVGNIVKFSVPGGSLLSAHLDYARTVARRAEREVWALKPPISGPAAKYLNRLSSLLFVLARYANKKARISETNPDYK